MFNMTKVGVNISNLRKDLNMTQTELADRLGISFQAVSNWERGLSCPDIAKLYELSELFGVTIDEILENEKASVIIQDINEDKPVPDIQVEEIEELGPILKPEQVNRLADQSKEISIEQLASIAPFLSQNFIEDIFINKCKNIESLNGLCAIAPFISQELLELKAKEFVSKNNSLSEIVGIAPFISQQVLEKLAEQVIKEKDSLNELSAIAPFLSEEFLDLKAKEFVGENNSLAEIAGIAPFISEELLSKFAIEKLKNNDLNSLVPIMPFIKTSLIEDYFNDNKNIK